MSEPSSRLGSLARWTSGVGPAVPRSAPVTPSTIMMKSASTHKQKSGICAKVRFARSLRLGGSRRQERAMPALELMPVKAIVRRKTCA